MKPAICKSAAIILLSVMGSIILRCDYSTIEGRILVKGNEPVSYTVVQGTDGQRSW